MNWFLSILIGLLTGVAGCFLAGALGGLCVEWYRVSSREGAAGYFVILIAFVGLILGVILGIVCSRYVAAWPSPGFLKALGVSLGAIVGLFGIAVGLCRLAADLPPEIDGRGLELAVEIRLPRGFEVPPRNPNSPAHAEVVLLRSSSQPDGELRFGESWMEEGRRIVPATVPLATRAAEKFLRVYFNQDVIELFPLKLRSNPKRADLEWSAWVQQGWKAGESRPSPEAGMFIRYRVQLEPPPPPVKSQAEYAAEEAAKDQAKFDAMPADAPITEWFQYTRYGTPPERLAVAVTNITARPQFVPELIALIRSEDAETAHQALDLVQHLPAIPPELVAELSADGKRIAETIRVFNSQPVEADPSYEAAAKIASRFHYWIDAARTVHKLQVGDLSPELLEILKLSRVRTDSHAMRRDVCRIASFYTQQWTGLEPLPTDPKPRG